MKKIQRQLKAADIFVRYYIIRGKYGKHYTFHQTYKHIVNIYYIRLTCFVKDEVV